MGGGGPELQITGEQKKDPVTMAREKALWDQAQTYADTNPFSQQYGGPSAMPGMGAMSQAGQEYLTNSILGPGQYQAQNLGFTDYEAPSSAGPISGPPTPPPGPPTPPPGPPIITKPPPFIGDPEGDPEDDGYRVPAPPIYTPPIGAPPEGEEVKFESPNLPSKSIDGSESGASFDTIGADTIQGRLDRLPQRTPLPHWNEGRSGDNPSYPPLLPQSPPPATPQGLLGSRAEEEDKRAPGPTRVGPNDPGWEAFLAAEDARSPGRGAGLRADAESHPDWTWDIPAEQRVPGRSYSQTVGVREMEEGAEATRRMLEQAAPSAPTYADITDPTIGTTTVAGVTDIGDIGQATAAADQGPWKVDAPAAIGQTTVAGPTDISAQSISAPTAYDASDVTGQTTQEIYGVDPAEFEGASFLGGPAIEDYMNTAGVEAQVSQAEEDYQRQLNALQAQQAGSGAFGSRADLQDLGALEAQQRNVAQIRGAGYDRAAGLMEADIGRQQEAGLQSQRLGVDVGRGSQALEAQRRESDAARAQQANLANQQLDLEVGRQTQSLGTQVDIQNAQNALSASQANLNAAMQSGDRQAQIDAQRQMRDAELNVETAANTQRFQAQSGMQTQQLQTQVAMQNAQNEIAIAEQNMRSAIQTGSQQAQIDAQRQMSQAQMGLDAATRNQAAGLQAAGMGLDAQGQFRQQQMQNAQQLADIGGMQQGATFNAADQLQQMGAQQEQTQRLQQAWDYEQWLRGQEGGAQALALRQGMMPGGSMQTFGRKPDRFGQILGAATSLGGAAITKSDVRLKENIKYAGVKNGFNLYEFNYLGSENRYRGVMAQEVMKQRPDAVDSRDGILGVNYDAIGIQLEAV